MYNSLDLFCGAGGFSKGLESTKKIISKIALDFDKDAISTYSYNFPNAQTFCGDIRDKDIKKNIIQKAKESSIDIIVGGPPCQGFSLKGKRLGIEDPRNFLFLEYFEIVSIIKPKIFVIENVKSLISTCDGFFIKQIYEKFHSIGYEISYDVLNAYNFGTPQKRERTIIIGMLGKIKPIMPQELSIKYTVRDAISDLNYLNAGEGEIEQDYKTKPISDYQIEMRKNCDILTWHKATSHSNLAIHKLSLIPPECGKEFLPKELWGNQKFKTTWSRLEWDKPSVTIDTRFDTPSNGKNSHPVLNRAITPREAARLQGFPDNFKFIGVKTSVRKQIGNAVPIPLGKAIGLSIIKNLEILEKNK